MATRKKKTFADALKSLLTNPKTRRALDEAVDPDTETPAKDEDTPESGTPAQATDEGEDRLAALEAKVEEMSILVRQLAKAEQAESQDEDPEESVTADEDEPEKTDDEDEPADGTKTGDRAPGKRRTTDARTVDSDTKARAVILFPGLHVEDSDKRCAVQRAALRVGMKDKAVEGVVKATLRGSTLDSCDCVTLDAAFVAASEVAKAGNNKRTADGLSKAQTKDFGKATSPADINAANAQYYKKGA